MRYDHDHRTPSRREFLSSAALLTAGLSLGCANGAERAFAPAARMPNGATADRDSDEENEDRSRLPAPDESGIEHVVLVMMENRSFDHLLGWLPGADGRQAGLVYQDRNGVAFRTYPLAPDYQGCGHPDPDHSYEGGRIQYDDGRCDGFLRSGDNDIYAIGYYRRPDLPFFGRAAADWTSFDRYFAAIMSETFPNRFIQHAAQTDRLDDSLDLSTLPTIWDRLADNGVTGQYYFSDLPFLLLWGPKYLPIMRPIDAFMADCAAGTLPQVSFVEPRFIGEDEGTSNDDHPHADIRAGEAFLNDVYTAVTHSPAWPHTVLVINFDEWGGFFDHVPPDVTPISDLERAAGNADGRRGFRTPALVVSPFARREYVSHRVFDHTSVLRMIEWRWTIDPLTVRDQTANNLAEVLDFRHPRLRAPQYLVPPVVGQACPSTNSTIASAALPSSTRFESWRGLQELAGAYAMP